MRRVAHVYRELAEMPSVTGGRLMPARVPTPNIMAAAQSMAAGANVKSGGDTTREEEQSKDLAESSYDRVDNSNIAKKQNAEDPKFSLPTAVIASKQKDLRGDTTLRFETMYDVNPDSRSSGQNALKALDYQPLSHSREIPERHKISSFSPSGLRKAVVTANRSDPNGTPTRIEIFHSNRRVMVYDGTKHHGQIHTKGPFARLAWSWSEKYLAFVAERKQAKHRPFFTDHSELSEPTVDGKKVQIGSGFEYQEDFGEQLQGYRCPEIFVLTIATGEVFSTGHWFAESEHAGSPVWCPPSPNGERENLLATVWPLMSGRRLGMIYYSTRRSRLVFMNMHRALKTKVQEDSTANEDNSKGDNRPSDYVIPMTRVENDQSPRDPRFSLDGHTLVWLCSADTDLHGSCLKLRKIHWNLEECRPGGIMLLREAKLPSPFPAQATLMCSSTFKTGRQLVVPETVVDIRRGEVKVDDGLVGIFARPGGTPDRIWLSDSQHIVLGSTHRSRGVLLLINTKSGEVRRLEPPPTACRGSEEAFDMKLLDVFGTRILCSCSCVNRTDAVFIFDVDISKTTSSAGYDADPYSYISSWIYGSEEKKETVVTWMRVTMPISPLDQKIALSKRSITSRVLQVCPHSLSKENNKSPESASSGTETFECVLALPQNKPTDADLPAVILYPHGGPHSSSFTGFSPEIAMLCHLGFAVAQVNYRGSLGFGQDSLESLPGNCGKQDVSDCMQALEAVISTGLVDSDRVFVMGGSHGGFLTTHLISRYPDRFLAAAVRNPVVNIGANYMTCDIPDWCHSEVGTGVSIGPVSGNGATEVVPPPNENHLRQMWLASPVSLVERVKSPLLLMLGTKDRRVPMGQSMQYYYALRARGVKVKLNIYDMDHSLTDSVRGHTNVWISVALWFMEAERDACGSCGSDARDSAAAKG